MIPKRKENDLLRKSPPPKLADIGAEMEGWGAPLLTRGVNPDHGATAPTDGRKVRDSPPESRMVILQGADGTRYSAQTEDGQNFFNLVRLPSDAPFIDELLEPGLLDAQPGPRDKIWITVVRYVMFFSCALWLAMAFVAFVAYSTWVSSPLVWMFMWIFLGCTVVFYVLVGVMHTCKTKLRFLAFGAYLGSLCIWMTMLTVALNDEAIIQMSIILFLSTLGVGLYTVHSTRTMDKRWVAAILGIATVVGWCAGIVAYYNDSDWITATIVILVAAAFAVYNWLFINYVRVENYPEDKRSTALVDLHTLPGIKLTQLIGKVLCNLTAPAEANSDIVELDLGAADLDGRGDFGGEL